MVRGGGLVRVSVVTDVPGADIPEPTDPGVHLRTVRSEERLWVEAAYAVRPVALR